MGHLQKIGSFGDVAAEDDAVLSYFLKTDAVDAIESGKQFLILGRKGSGKTALTKYFSKNGAANRVMTISLSDYPWKIHESRINTGASDIECYVSSWRYLIAVRAVGKALQISNMLVTDAERSAYKFLFDNYGAITPELGDILRPKKLKLSKASFIPSIMGNSIGGVELETKTGGVGPELDELASMLLDCAETIASQRGIKKISFHFDELDQGLSDMDDQRKKLLVGLIVAARNIRSRASRYLSLSPIIYLRTDIWEQLQFSDKNKITQSFAYNIEWNSATLLALIDERIKSKIGKDYAWIDIDDELVMRGSQPKWNHIVSRTFMRPRDVISFLNFALLAAKKRDPDADVFDNKDIQDARQSYSQYLKRELDDEISPHWPKWDEALQAARKWPR